MKQLIFEVKQVLLKMKELFLKIKQLILGIVVFSFGLCVGGIGIASAGIGIGIPMIPIGVYLIYRGWRIFENDSKNEQQNIINPVPLEEFEKTSLGKMGLGIILIIIGLGTSALLIGIPILLLGIWYIYQAYKVKCLNNS